MTKEAKAIQDLLDPTTGAQVAQQYSFPIAVGNDSDISTGTKYLVINNTTEIVLYQWPNYGGLFKATGLERLEKNTGIEIPAAELISELEQLISEIKSKR